MNAQDVLNTCRGSGVELVRFIYCDFSGVQRGKITAIDDLSRTAWQTSALALPFAAGAVFANVFPFPKRSDTEVLTILHLPIALWMAVGFAYVRGRWFSGGG